MSAVLAESTKTNEEKIDELLRGQKHMTEMITTLTECVIKSESEVSGLKAQVQDLQTKYDRDIAVSSYSSTFAYFSSLPFTYVLRTI